MELWEHFFSAADYALHAFKCQPKLPIRMGERERERRVAKVTILIYALNEIQSNARQNWSVLQKCRVQSEREACSAERETAMKQSTFLCRVSSVIKSLPMWSWEIISKSYRFIVRMQTLRVNSILRIFLFFFLALPVNARIENKWRMVAAVLILKEKFNDFIQAIANRGENKWAKYLFKCENYNFKSRPNSKHIIFQHTEQR